MPDSPSPDPLAAEGGGGLPEEIVGAIKKYGTAEAMLAAAGPKSKLFRLARDCSRLALDATILQHLSGALAARDKLRAERGHTDLRIRAQRARLRELEPCVGGAVATDGRIRLLQFARTKAAECRALRREKAAALARAERLEKALEPFAEAADNLENSTRDSDHLWESPEAMMLSAGDLRAAKAAIASPAPVEERDHGAS